MTKRWPCFPPDVTGFLKENQPAKWQALEALLGSKTAASVLDGLSKELEREGTLNEEGIEATIAAISPWAHASRDAFASKAVLALTVSMGNMPK